MYHPDVLTVWFCLLAISQAYVNVAFNKPACRQYYIPELNPCVSLVDADRGSCISSETTAQKDCWWVNLTSIHSIHHITIYFSTDNLPWDPQSSKRIHLGFSVYVSNTTNILQGTLCFKDDNFTLDTIPAVFTTTCPVHGQYVIYYNERLKGVIYPVEYSDSVSSYLCEIEVYGCPANGCYGSRNTLPCPDVNCQYCHIETGTCQGCKPGFLGHRCELVCDRGSFGYDCNETCGHCRDVDTCSNINGTCLTGCDDGYQGDRCKTPCPVGYFGQECTETCISSYTCDGCNDVRGSCDYGCRPGWIGYFCQKKQELDRRERGRLIRLNVMKKTEH